MTYIIGLTGGIGSGKTLISDYFQNRGVPIIDTDVIARQIVEPGQPALQQLVAKFGQQILHNDGSLNRDELRTIAFSSSQNKAALDAITHPAIYQLSLQQIEQADYAYCIVVIPLLNQESVFTELLQRVLVVTADKSIKVERIKQRSGLSASEITRIMQSQIDDQQRLEFADDIIENNGSIEQAENQAERLHQKYLQIANSVAQKG